MIWTISFFFLCVYFLGVSGASTEKMYICYDQTKPVDERFSVPEVVPDDPAVRATCFTVAEGDISSQQKLIARVPRKYVKIETFPRPQAVEMNANEKRLVDTALAASQTPQVQHQLVQKHKCPPRESAEELVAEQEAFKAQIRQIPTAQALALLVEKLYSFALCEAVKRSKP